MDSNISIMHSIGSIAAHIYHFSVSNPLLTIVGGIVFIIVGRVIVSMLNRYDYSE